MTNPLRGAVAAALMATMPMVALAQASASASAPAPSTPKPVASNVGATYRSAFEGYRRFDEQKVQPWRDANDNVGRIGGWQAYAREASSVLDEAPAASKPGTPAAPPAAPPAATPASMPDEAHKGHGGHATPKKP